VMDWYCLDAILWLFEWVGDIAVGAIDTAVFLKLAADVDASLWDKFKIVTIQTFDTLFWSIPIVWDIADFFFKSNKKSAQILQKAFEKNRSKLEEKYGKETVAKLMEAHTTRFQKATDTANKVIQLWAGALNEVKMAA
jgi:hypothetical protein